MPDNVNHPENYTAGGAVECVFAQPHWLCGVFRREYAGAARPRLRQRVFDSLDSPHAAAGLCWCVFAAPSPGYTERPARVQFMLGRVGLY